MLNRYEVIDSGTVIEILNEYAKRELFKAPERIVVIYANGCHIKNWKILISAIDYQKVNDAISGRWYIRESKGTIYAEFCKTINGKRTYIKMHRLITDCPDHLVVDHHPHHFGLDNRRGNLSNVTVEENSGNAMKKIRHHYLPDDIF